MGPGLTSITDPFGNYLCQKLLEYASDEQRNLICESVAQDLVNISLNMHGTRAVQKMIDFLSTRRQIHSIIVALSLHVVVLIKDLNGNHVIQKCLNKLAPEDNQFIYNAVAANCVEVATHRHGCCVLQRCVDHASDAQRVQLVNEITYNALTLVQDPYGNYVSFVVGIINTATDIMSGRAIHSRLERQPFQRRCYPSVCRQHLCLVCAEVQLERHREVCSGGGAQHSQDDD
jgi:hypothetical protein